MLIVVENLLSLSLRFVHVVMLHSGRESSVTEPSICTCSQAHSGKETSVTEPSICTCSQAHSGRESSVTEPHV